MSGPSNQQSDYDFLYNSADFEMLLDPASQPIDSFAMPTFNGISDDSGSFDFDGNSMTASHGVSQNINASNSLDFHHNAIQNPQGVSQNPDMSTSFNFNNIAMPPSLGRSQNINAAQVFGINATAQQKPSAQSLQEYYQQQQILLQQDRQNILRKLDELEKKKREKRAARTASKAPIETTRTTSPANALPSKPTPEQLHAAQSTQQPKVNLPGQASAGPPITPETESPPSGSNKKDEDCFIVASKPKTKNANELEAPSASTTAASASAPEPAQAKGPESAPAPAPAPQAPRLPVIICKDCGKEDGKGKRILWTRDGFTTWKSAIELIEIGSKSRDAEIDTHKKKIENLERILENKNYQLDRLRESFKKTGSSKSATTSTKTSNANSTANQSRKRKASEEPSAGSSTSSASAPQAKRPCKTNAQKAEEKKRADEAAKKAEAEAEEETRKAMAAAVQQKRADDQQASTPAASSTNADQQHVEYEYDEEIESLFRKDLPAADKETLPEHRSNETDSQQAATENDDSSSNDGESDSDDEVSRKVEFELTEDPEERKQLLRRWKAEDEARTVATKELKA